MPSGDGEEEACRPERASHGPWALFVGTACAWRPACTPTHGGPSERGPSPHSRCKTKPERPGPLEVGEKASSD